jgi:ATP-dependent RNA/DNA helicase IGHMBP2
VMEVLRTAQVVLGTTTSVSPLGALQGVPVGFFDVCVIDEAGQALEASCWTPILYAPKSSFSIFEFIIFTQNTSKLDAIFFF